MSLCSLKRVKNGNVFPAFFHAAFHPAWITFCVFQASAITELYHDGDTFFNQLGGRRLTTTVA